MIWLNGILFALSNDENILQTPSPKESFFEEVTNNWMLIHYKLPKLYREFIIISILSINNNMTPSVGLPCQGAPLT